MVSGFGWYVLLALVGTAVVWKASDLLERSSKRLSAYYGLPPVVQGAIVVAAGTSLPDTLVSVRAAKENNGVTSLANVLGSNVFDLLIAVPAGVLVAGSADIDFAVAVPLMGFLTFATVLVFGFLRTELTLSKTESWGLLGFYCLFLVWMVLETVGVTHVVPGA